MNRTSCRLPAEPAGPGADPHLRAQVAKGALGVESALPSGGVGSLLGTPAAARHAAATEHGASLRCREASHRRGGWNQSR